MTRTIALTLTALLVVVSCSQTIDTDRTEGALVTPAYVQSAFSCPQTAQTTVSVKLASAERAGDLLVVVVGWDDSTTNVSAVTDALGNSYALAVGPTRRSGSASQSIYYALGIPAGNNTVTVVLNHAAPFVDLRVLEYSGVSAFDKALGASGSSAGPSSGALANVTAGDLLVASDTIGTATKGSASGWTYRLMTTPDADLVEDRIAATAGSYTATASISPSSWWVMQVAAFKVGTVSGGTGGATATGGSGGASASGGSRGTAGSGGAAGAAGGAAGAAGGAGLPATGGQSGAGGAAAGQTGQAGVPGSAGSSPAGASGSAGMPDAGAGGGPGGQAGSAAQPDGGVSAFPLSYSSNRRYLQDIHGTPFPILGRTAWNVVSLSALDASTFLADTLSKGYDALEFAAIWRDSRAANIPFDGNGDAPFLKTLGGAAWNGNLTYNNVNTDGPDFSTPNPAYWSFVARFVDQCAANGIAVLMFPAYVGFNGEESEGWMGEMTANGAAKMQAYGAYLGNLFATRGNVIWMAGGDYGTDTNQFTSAQLAVESALLSGVRSVAGASTFWSAEWTSESTAVQQANFGSSMTLNGAYSWAGATITQGRRAYAYTPAEPAFLLEEPYDEEGPDANDVNPNATQPVRRFQWWGWLSTIGGYMSGNGYIWPFTPGVWEQHLSTPGARDMANLNAFIRSIAWQQLVPDGFGAKDLVTAGLGSEDELGRSTMVTAAANPTGTLLVAYVPPAHTGSFTIDMTNMSGQTTARWLNPSTGIYTMIATLPNTGQHTFTVPGDNGTGFTDWTLVLTVP